MKKFKMLNLKQLPTASKEEEAAAVENRKCNT